MTHYLEDVATDDGKQRGLNIVGRPKPGCSESWIILEEPGQAVLMHWTGKNMLPHFKRGDCPHCNGIEEPKPLWYVGAKAEGGSSIGILELTATCFRTVEAAARKMKSLQEKYRDELAILESTRNDKDIRDSEGRRCGKKLSEEDFQRRRAELIEKLGPDDFAPSDAAPVFTGLRVTISRGKFEKSPRLARCEARAVVKGEPWAFQTRLELARIWQVPTRPKIHQAEQA